MAGPLASICDECVDICSEIVAEKLEESTQAAMAAVTAETFFCGLCKQPRPSSDGALIPGRGTLCLACVDAVRAVYFSRADVGAP